MFITIVELEYLISSVLGFIVGCIMLWKIDQARRRGHDVLPDKSRSVLISKAGWRYSILSFILLCMVAVAAAAILGEWDPAGIILLAIQPPLLLALLTYEWITDSQVIRLRRNRLERKDDRNQKW